MTRPILFSGAMVRAILDGRKTQTRRIVKPQPEYAQRDGRLLRLEEINPDLWPTATARLLPSCPYGAPGDRLWVRETWRRAQDGVLYYRACTGDDSFDGNAWKPSIHMPRAYSRITLEITSVRVERVQDIGPGDAYAEGISEVYPEHAVFAFRRLWDSINAERGYGWDANPWVWVVDFQRVEEGR
jgi:hypothetical protein